MTANRENLELLARLKFDGIEIPGFWHLNPERTTEQEVRKLKDLLSSYDLEVAASNVIYPRDFRHASPDEAIRSRSINYTCDLIRLSSELGNKVLIWGGGAQRSIPSTVMRGQGITWLKDLLCEASRVAEDYGVRIGIEILNRAETNVFNTVSEALEVIRRIGSEALGITGDVYHMSIEETSVLDGIREAGGMLVHVHVADHNREVPGMGNLDFKKVMGTLREIGYDRYLSIEAKLGPEPETRLRNAKGFLEKYIH